MLNKFKELWSSSTLPIKALLIITCPLLVLLYFGYTALVEYLDNKKAASVQAKSDAYTKQEQKNEIDMAYASGKIEQLNQDKAQALKDAENDKPTPTDFFNDRNYPSSK